MDPKNTLFVVTQEAAASPMMQRRGSHISLDPRNQTLYESTQNLTEMVKPSNDNSVVLILDYY